MEVDFLRITNLLFGLIGPVGNSAGGGSDVQGRASAEAEQDVQKGFGQDIRRF